MFFRSQQMVSSLETWVDQKRIVLLFIGIAGMFWRKDKEQIMAYDDTNIFARILRGEIPAKSVYEDEYALAFHDINPQAPQHILVIPKGPYQSMDDFTAHAPDALIAGFFKAVGHVARQVGAAERGYRILANHGADAHQEVPHLHIHIFAGRPLGPMLTPMKD